jgi:hypothetical protein
MRVSEIKHRLRERSEYGSRLAAMEEVGRRYPGSSSKSALPQVGLFWRYLFVPLLRRVPWSFKHKAMRTLKLTAQGWPEDARRFGEPWRPPAGAERTPSTPAHARPQEIGRAER